MAPSCDGGRGSHPRAAPVSDDDDDDDAELEASGYAREMPRRFSTFSLLALAYALICTWNGFAR